MNRTLWISVANIDSYKFDFELKEFLIASQTGERARSALYHAYE